LLHLLRPRTLLYSAILLAIIAVTVWSLATRIPLKVDILRDRSTLYREADEGRIENAYTCASLNTDEAPHRYAISIAGIEGIAIVGERMVDVPAISTRTILLSASVEDAAGHKGANPVFF